MKEEEAKKIIAEEMEKVGFPHQEGRQYYVVDVLAVLFKRIQELEKRMELE